MLRGLHARTGINRLCLAGGCAMNSVANGKIRERNAVHRRLHPAGVRRQRHGARRRLLRLESGAAAAARLRDAARLLGAVVRRRRRRCRARSRAAKICDAQRCTVRCIDDDHELYEWTASRIADGDVVGWFQGRMEWGARALGNRSILADPRRADMREIINTKIKFREKFRPFAPSVLEEAHADYFTGSVPDPFMMQVYPVQAGQARYRAGRHARRRIGPPADRQRRGQRTLLVAHPGRSSAAPACRSCSTRRSTRTNRSCTSRPKRSTASCGREWTRWCSAIMW